jgi:hypothetical protein
MEEILITGSCLCGKVAYKIRKPLGIFHYCHCSRCRKFTGSAFSSNLMVAPGAFTWTAGEEFIGRYELESAEEFATTFCKNCGSSLPWLTKSQRMIVVPAGTLDSDPTITPTQNIFHGSRALWYTEPSALPKHEELPPRIE